MSYTGSKDEVARERVALARELLPHGKKRKSVMRKATAHRLCGAFVALRRCGACSEDREHSGRLMPPNGGMPCGLRCCPYCARVASQERFERVLGVIAGLPRVEGYRLRSIVVTVQRDPQAEGPHTVEAMRATTRAFGEVVSRAWREFLRRPGAGMLRVQENSGSGHIHVHLLYFGPFVNRQALGAFLSEAWKPHEEATHRRLLAERIWVEDVSGSDESIVREVVKYATKAPSPMSEGWLRGAKRDVMNARLAARYEFATSELALTQMYGAFRGRVEEQPKIAPPQPHEDQDVACPCCGVVGDWTMVVEPVRQACHRMHAKGRAVLAGSRWRPPEWRGT